MVTPINLSYLYTPPKVKRSKKDSVSKKSETKEVKTEDCEDILHFKTELNILGEDADSSQELWTQTFPECAQEAKDFLASMKSIYPTLDFYANLPRLNTIAKLTPKQSLLHLTVPEALLIFDILQNPKKYQKRQRVSLIPYRTQATPLVVNMKLQWQEQQDRIGLQFNRKNNHTRILDKNKIVGKADYIIHQGKLEEIKGDFYQKSFLLDLVWDKKDKVKYEKIRLGKYKTDLIRQTKGKKGFLRHINESTQVFKVEKMHSAKLNKRYFITFKKTKLGMTNLLIQLLFAKYLLHPIAGEIIVSK